MKKIKWISLLTLALLGGCRKSPSERVQDASNGGGVGQFGVASSFVIFSNELKTGGGAFLYPGGENQALTFSDQSNPVSARSIRYTWNGQPAQAGGSDHGFAGFDLMHTIDQASYASTSGRDLSQAGYTKITFAARGTLSTNTVLKIEAASDGSDPSLGHPEGCIRLSTDGTLPSTYVEPNPSRCTSLGTLSADWQTFTLTIPSAAFANVKDFFKATLIFSDPFVGAPAGQGGTVYFDQIEYKP